MLRRQSAGPLTSRIGIYAGTFDPVHTGHITFALQALQLANLDKVYFLPERKPAHKQGTEHFGHRVAMLTRALKPHPNLDTIELVDVSFTVARTMPQLTKKFPDDTIVFLVGSDVLQSIPDWPNSAQLLKHAELVVGARADNDIEGLKTTIDAWETKPVAATIFTSYAPDVSSSKVRDALRTQQPTPGILHSVARYSNKNWLYVSVPMS
jgi:nicotinate-nucleotide adenylyltransferase